MQDKISQITSKINENVIKISDNLELEKLGTSALSLGDIPKWLKSLMPSFKMIIIKLEDATFSKIKTIGDFEVITTSQKLVIPGFEWRVVVLVGGGGGSGSGINRGGGGSGYVESYLIYFPKYEELDIVIGLGGLGGANGCIGKSGNSTNVTINGKILTASYGLTPVCYMGANGFSGGGACLSDPGSKDRGGIGGSNGSDGEKTALNKGGTGSKSNIINLINQLYPLITAGEGGIGGIGTEFNKAGGGAGGLYVPGHDFETDGQKAIGEHHGKGGKGFGAGGGGGSSDGKIFSNGGNGAPGCVIIGAVQYEY
jgi:hypothetical protein